MIRKGLVRPDAGGKDADRFNALTAWADDCGWRSVACSWWYLDCDRTRFADVEARTRVTASVEVRILGFSFWGTPNRVGLTYFGDYARGYTNAGLSLGFWR